MKIDTSQIDLVSARHYQETREMKVETRTAFGDLIDQKLSGVGSRADPLFYPQVFSETGSISGTVESKSTNSKWYTFTSWESENAVALTDRFRNELDKLVKIMDSIIEQVNARCSHSFSLTGFDRIDINRFKPPAMPVVSYRHQEHHNFTYTEEEQTMFQADGMVQTADGRTLDFSFGMNLDRSFFKQEETVYTKEGVALIDPLVVSLDDTMPGFSDTWFSFDMDMDGQEEQLRLPVPGTGFLSFDRNKDGIVNDGSELFGPSTGHGFQELSAYDDDNNLWIDENDAIFDQLTVWENYEDGAMHLTRIKDAGIGAIYLANAETPFSLTDDNNQVLGRIKRSGIALNEDGTILPVQEMDWTV